MTVQAATGKRLYTIGQLADYFGITTWYWRTQIREGRLPIVTVGRKQLVDALDVEKFISDYKRLK